jgi:hypothetical protein
MCAARRSGRSPKPNLGLGHGYSRCIPMGVVQVIHVLVPLQCIGSRCLEWSGQIDSRNSDRFQFGR